MIIAYSLQREHYQTTCTVLCDNNVLLQGSGAIRDVRLHDDSNIQLSVFIVISGRDNIANFGCGPFRLSSSGDTAFCFTGRWHQSGVLCCIIVLIFLTQT